MTRTCAARCDRPAHHDLAICLGCCADLERHLAEVPALAHELDLQVSRQTATGGNGGSRSTTRPLAFDPAASAAAARLRNVLSTWVRDIAGGEQPAGPVCRACAHHTCAIIRRGTYPADTPAAMATWLLSRIEILRTHAAVAEICRDFDALLAQPSPTFAGGAVWRAIDRRPDLMYAGICSTPTPDGECPEHLYARPEASAITCRACRTVHDVTLRREVLLAALEDQLMTAFEIARAAAHLGVVDRPERAEKLIAKWVLKARIQARGVNVKGRPTYRFGEARDLLDATPPRHTADSARPASEVS